MPPPPPPRAPVVSPWRRLRPPADPLDESMMRMCYRAVNTLPMNTFSPADGTWPGARELLDYPPLGTPNPEQIMNLEFRQKLMTVLASANGNGNNAAQNVVHAVTIRRFFAMTSAERMQFIDDVWNATAIPHAYNTAAQAMQVHAQGQIPGASNRPFPSSWCPVPGQAGTYHRRHANAGQDAWNELAVGFRCENGFDRPLAYGFTQQRANNGFMTGPNRGQRITGTVVDYATDAGNGRYWSLSADMWNESAVCVSRNLFGACAFPERSSVGDKYLFAIDCSGLNGFDCEDVQFQANRVWRPGEKAFANIPSDRIIGYVQIRRNGGPVGGGMPERAARP